jgi:hypothetical protein
MARMACVNVARACGSSERMQDAAAGGKRSSFCVARPGPRSSTMQASAAAGAVRSLAQRLGQLVFHDAFAGPG